MCVKAAAAADDDDDDDDDDYYYNTAKLPSRAVNGANSSTQLTGFDDDDNDDDDYVSTAVNDAAGGHDGDDGDSDDGSIMQMLLADSHSSNESRVTGGNIRVSTEMNRTVNASSSLHHSSTVRRQPLNTSSSSSLSWPSSAVRRQQLNHAIISEKRQQALRKESIRAQKLRLVHEVSLRN